MLGSDVLVGALWLIAALGAAVFAAQPVGRTGLGWLTGGFVAGAWLVRVGRLPEPGELAAGVALLAMLQLTRPGRPVLTALAAGVLAGVWSRILELQGLPMAVALPAAAALPATAALLTARRSAFAPREVLEEALAVVFASVILAALLPGLLDGWRSAQALNIEEPALDALGIPGWAAAVGLAALASGGGWAVWSRQ